MNVLIEKSWICSLDLRYFQVIAPKLGEESNKATGAHRHTNWGSPDGHQCPHTAVRGVQAPQECSPQASPPFWSWVLTVCLWATITRMKVLAGSWPKSSHARAAEQSLCLLGSYCAPGALPKSPFWMPCLHIFRGLVSMLNRELPVFRETYSNS